MNQQQSGTAAGKSQAQEEYSVFKGKIHVVDLATINGQTEDFEGRAWLENRVTNRLPLGWDLEWQPDRSKDSDNPVALMQFADANTALLVRTHRTKNWLPYAICKALCSDTCKKIGVGFDGPDKTKMQNTFNFIPSGVEDLADIARKKGLPETGLKLLSARFGYNMKKDSRTARSNWASEYLSADQVQYAAEDAWMTFLLYDKLKELPDPVISQEEGYEAVNAGLLEMQPGWEEQGIVRRHDGLYCVTCDKGPMTVPLVVERHMEGAKHKKKMEMRNGVVPGQTPELSEDYMVQGIYTADGINELQEGEYKCKICDAGPFKNLTAVDDHLKSKRHLKKTAPPEPAPEKVDPVEVAKEQISEALWNFPDYVSYEEPATLRCTLCDKKGDQINAVKVMKMHLGKDSHAKKCRSLGNPEIVYVEERDRLELMESGRAVVRTGHVQPKRSSSSKSSSAKGTSSSKSNSGSLATKASSGGNAIAGAMPDGWSEHLDPDSGDYYYYNKHTQESTWERPGGPRPTPPQPAAQKPKEQAKFRIQCLDGSSQEVPVLTSGLVDLTSLQAAAMKGRAAQNTDDGEVCFMEGKTEFTQEHLQSRVAGAKRGDVFSLELTMVKKKAYILPPGWQVVKVENGQYYADLETQASTWEAPPSYEHGDWQRLVDQDGRAYWGCTQPYQFSFYEGDEAWERLLDDQGPIYWSCKARGIRFFEQPQSAKSRQAQLQGQQQTAATSAGGTNGSGAAAEESAWWTG